VKYLNYVRKRCIVNPARGPFHFRAPSRILYRVIRGMIPHKTPRGAAALGRLKVFEGIPPAYNCQKRLVVPNALRVLRLAPGRKFTTVKRLSSEMGWKYQEVVEKLEEKRKNLGKVYYEKRKTLAKLKATALKNVDGQLTEVKKNLAKGNY